MIASAASRQVQRLHLRAPDDTLAGRGVRLIEDALRTASLPDAGAGMLLFRRLALGRFGADVAPQTLSLALERRVAALRGLAVHAAAPGAAQSPAVWFRDALEAHTTAGVAHRRRRTGARMVLAAGRAGAATGRRRGTAPARGRALAAQATRGADRLAAVGPRAGAARARGFACARRLAPRRRRSCCLPARRRPSGRLRLRRPPTRDAAHRYRTKGCGHTSVPLPKAHRIRAGRGVHDCSAKRGPYGGARRTSARGFPTHRPTGSACRATPGKPCARRGHLGATSRTRRLYSRQHAPSPAGAAQHRAPRRAARIGDACSRACTSRAARVDDAGSRARKSPAGAGERQARPAAMARRSADRGRGPVVPAARAGSARLRTVA